LGLFLFQDGFFLEGPDFLKERPENLRRLSFPLEDDTDPGQTPGVASKIATADHKNPCSSWLYKPHRIPWRFALLRLEPDEFVGLLLVF
jgi:hypothetical protein